MSYKMPARLLFGGRVFVYAIIVSIIGISGCRKNNAPDAPAMPATNSYGSTDTKWVDSTTYFYTSTKDPEKEDVSYQFNWGDGETSKWSEYIKSGDIMTMGHKYIQANTYSVKVKSKDIHKNESDWSQAFTLKILTKSAAPESVTIVSQKDTGEINKALKFSVRAVDPEGDSIKFWLKVGQTDSTLIDTMRISGTTYTAEHTFQSVGAFVEVRAKAQDKQGGVSAWSLPCTVTITPPKKPTKPDAPTVSAYPEKFIHTPYMFSDQVPGEKRPLVVRFNWGNDSSLSVIGSNHSDADTTYEYASLPNAYASASVFNLTVNAVDDWGQYSDTSDPLTITISDNCINYWDTDACLGIAIYQDTLWVVDLTNHQIKMFNTAGVFLGTIGANILKAPKYVAVDSSCVYVTDASSDFEEIHKVYVFNKNGTLKTWFGGKGSGMGSEGKFSYPTGIAVDNEFIYVVDSFNKRIQKFKKDSGTYESVWGLPTEALGMKIYDNELYVALAKTDLFTGSGDSIYVFNTNGVKVGSIGQKATGSTALDTDKYLSVPCDVAVTADAVYVIEASYKSNNNRVQKFSKATGAFVNRWGEKGTAQGQFKAAQGIAVDAAGNIYVVDTGNCRIQVFRP